MDIRSTLFLSCLCLSLYITGGYALQCYDCMYFRLETESSAANSVLRALSYTPACKFDEEGDRTEVNIRNCGAPGSGNVARCAVIKGEISTTLNVVVTDVPVKIYTVERNCIEVPANDPNYEGCHDDLGSRGQEIVRKAFDKVSLGSISFSGKACYYNEISGAPCRFACYLITIVMYFFIGIAHFL